jgi:hypothetical protein
MTHNAFLSKQKDPLAERNPRQKVLLPNQGQVYCQPRKAAVLLTADNSKLLPFWSCETTKGNAVLI